MRRWLPWLLLASLFVGFWLAGKSLPTSGDIEQAPTVVSAGDVLASDAPTLQLPPLQPAARLPDFLPPEARDSIALIQRGGPFPHQQDGGVFGNRERRLPRQPRGWYREYTVDTPGLGHRGARRIVTGGAPPAQWYYTDDHYDSFRRFEPERVAP